MRTLSKTEPTVSRCVTATLSPNCVYFSRREATPPAKHNMLAFSRDPLCIDDTRDSVQHSS